MDPLPTPILKLLSVLEMLGMVQSHLSNQDRIRCSLVSKAFSALFIPLIWHTVTLGTLGKDHAFLYNPETVSAIMQHARHIHVIRVRTSKSLLPFLLAGVDKLINLHTLEFLCPTWLKDESVIIRALSVIPSSRPHDNDNDNDNDRDSYEDVSLKILSATDYSTCSHMTGGRHQGGKNWLDDPEVFLMQHQRSYQHFLMQQRLQWLFETQSQRPELTQQELEPQKTLMAPEQRRMQRRHAQQRYTQLMAQQLRWQRQLQLQRHLRIQQQVEDLIKSRIDLQQLQLEQVEQQQQQQLDLELTQEWQRQRQRLEQGRQRLQQLIEQQRDQALATQRIMHIQYQQQLHHHLYMQQRIQEQAMTAQLPLLHTHFLPVPDGNGDTSASELNPPATQPIYWNQDEQLLVQFLNFAPALKVFVRCDFPFWNSDLQKTVAKSLQNLTMLSIIAPPHQVLNSLQMPEPRWDFETLLQSGGPYVETLRFTVNAESPFPPTDTPNVLDDGQQQASTESKEVECEHPPRQQLRHLFLEEGYWFETHTKPVSLKSCPDLQSLSLASFHPTGLEMFAKTIREHCPRLENLAITFAPTITSPVANHNGLAHLLRACLKDDDVLPSSFSLLDSQERPDPVIVERVGLKSLRLESINFKLENLAFDTLLRHAKTLRHLAIRDCAGFSHLLEEDENLLQILESFEQLEKLDLLSQDSCCRTDQPAHMVVESMKKMKRGGENHEKGATGWACSRTLKVLRLIITSVPRQPSLAQIRAMVTTTPFPFPFPEPMPAADVNPEATAEDLFVGIEASHQMQREVCEALGSLEVLEELHLGMDFENRVIFHAIPQVGQQTMCLELSLESGLVQLEPLKQLRVLRVSGMDHRIGLGEVKWMCKHWPKLEAVYGLLRKRDEEHDKEIVQWLKENHPRIMYT
ncbi:hypothetical protein BG011_006390 [Mortierella polycephala]|uniref:F-box domain-containing protein n=1 Tax=Mortierella polycephala TaxID=41804 RepID=A0A9P6PVJ3_9FUNG|nr:hypothetical protein BG011_006390 [Mortierella polycephala]